MKRLATIFAAAVLLAALPGCSPLEERVQKGLEESASTALEEAYSEDADYQQYLTLQAQGQLDEDGNYISPTLNQLESGETTAMTGSVHVTFATNPCLSITYYTNAERTEPITDLSACYLNPGDSIYASNAVSTNPNSNLYRLAGFRIYEYDAVGSRMEQNTKEQAASASGLVYAIPAGFTGSEIAIFPLGEYPDRELALEVYTVDENGRTHALNDVGTWYVGNEEVQGRQATVSAVEPYTLSFTWEKGQYFYVASSPKCFTANPENGNKVQFWEADPTDEDRTYRVELCKCISLTLECDAKATIIVNGEEENAEEVKKNGTWKRTDLKYGDSIQVITEGKVQAKSDASAHISERQTADGYAFKVNDAESVTNSENLNITPIKQTYSIRLDESGEYGKAKYKLDGKSVKGEKISDTLTLIEAEAGQKLEITYKLDDKNYTFSGKQSNMLASITGRFAAESDKTEVEIEAAMDETTINPDDYFTVVKKGG